MAYKNKEDRAKNSKSHYLENKQYYKDKAKERTLEQTKKNKEFISEYLSNNSCVDCGEKDIIVLEFDHINDKKYNIADMIQTGYSLATIKKEIDKCEVRCANCHRRITHLRRTQSKGIHS